MHSPNVKQQAAAIVNGWIERAGIQKQQAAARVAMDYQSFYRAYLDPNRRLNQEPDRTLAVVRAFVERCTEKERTTAAEAIWFCTLAQLPLQLYDELRPLFPPDEWAQALSIYLPSQGNTAAEPARNGAARAVAHDQRPAPTASHAQPADQEPIPEVATLPLPHRMPLARNTLFCGREDELRTLARLMRGQATTGQAVAIAGLGGIGKTNLATEFVHRYGPWFPGGVFWLNCADAQVLPIELLACGKAGLVVRDDWDRLPFEEQLRLVRRAWQEPAERLLIFDNCEEEDILRTWRPTSGGCRVLLTSRRTIWSQALGVATLELRGLRRAESIALLRGHRPDLPAGLPELDALAAELGDLPLALHLAGSHLEVYRDDPPFGEPAHLLRELRAAGLLDHEAMRGIDVAPSTTNHELHVGRTFAIGLERLDLGDPVDACAHALLSRVGQLVPNTPFPRELLPATLGVDRDDPGALKRVARAIQRLIALGFLNTTEAMVVIHPLVAAFARGIGATAEARSAVERALIACVEESYPADDFQTLRNILPHFRRLTDAALSRDDTLAVQLCNTQPFLLEIAGDLPGGIAYFERARAMLASSGALASPLGAEVLNNLAEWYRFSGALDLSRRYHEQALAIRQQILEPDDPGFVESENNLGELLRQQGAFDEALPHYERAMEIATRRLGPRHFLSLTARSNLASLMFDQGHYAPAEQHFLAVLEIAQADFEPGDTRIARAQLNMGKVLRAQGHLERAQGHFKAAHAIFRAKFGDEHYETLRPLHQLALLAIDRGRPREGREQLRAIVEVCERVPGVPEPFTQRVREDLAAVDKMTR